MLHDQRFYVALAFVLFFVFFGRKIWGVVSGGLDSRADQVRRDLDEAGALRREAEKMLEDATRSREEAIAEAETLIENSRREATSIAEAARAKAESLLAQRERLAQDRIDASRRAAIQDISDTASNAAITAIRTLLQQEIAQNAAVSEELLTASLNDLPRSSSKRRGVQSQKD